tara:strand:- start:2203 stop:3030 length:828 start_codon:yes stop_codon:yes gene_type:complete
MTFDFPKDTIVNQYLAGMPTTDWINWTKPANCNFIYILAVGGGGGGGGGTTGGQASLGNSGAGSGSYGVIACPAIFFPDNVYIQVGRGGIGGNGSNGTIGGNTIIAFHPSNSGINNILTAAGGQFGYGSATNTIGTIGSVGNTMRGVGQVNRGTGTSAGSISTQPGPAGGSPIYGGAGGGGTGTYQTGGGMSSPYLNVSGLPNTPSGGTGVNGYVASYNPLVVFGGSAGGGVSSGAGGNGGNGIMGSGGGAGGNGTVNSAGGNGGDGFVIIISYL